MLEMRHVNRQRNLTDNKKQLAQTLDRQKQCDLGRDSLVPLYTRDAACEHVILECQRTDRTIEQHHP